MSKTDSSDVERTSGKGKPWHPCDDSIIPVVESLERFIRTSARDLPERLRYASTRPSYELAREWNEPGMGHRTRSAGRREMLQRWLQFNGFAADAKECDDRLEAVLDLLKDWETQAHEDHVWRQADPEPADDQRLFDESICEAYDRIIDEVTETTDYLRQLAAMIRGKIAKGGDIPTIKQGQDPKDSDFADGGKPDTPADPEAAAGQVECSQAKSVGTKLSWTQADVDKAIRKYKAERAEAYGRYAHAIEEAKGRKKQQLITQARKLFGRNSIAKHLGCAPAMVSNSQPWKAIKEELQLRKRRSSLKSARRIGYDIGVEKASVAAEKQQRLSEEQNSALNRQLNGQSPEELDSAASELFSDDY